MLVWYLSCMSAIRASDLVKYFVASTTSNICIETKGTIYFTYKIQLFTFTPFDVIPVERS